MGIVLYMEICFFPPQSGLCLGNSFLLLHVAEVHLFSLLCGISLYKSIAIELRIHLCILLSMDI